MADAPKILKDESLRTSYPKLNQAIDNANEALLTANTAKTKADTALSNSENTQTQLDTIVINGDSSVEAAQARVAADGSTYTTLQERLNSSDVQLTENAKRIDDIVIPKIEPLEYIAHRGFGGLAPENTLTAFTQAVALGADSLECDVQISSDGIAVLIHDETVDRTTNGTGNVKDMTLAALQALDAGSKFSTKFAGAKIPTFEDFLKYSKGRVKRIYPEIKGFRTIDDIKIMVDLVKQYNMEEMTVLCSFDLSHLSEVRKYSNKIIFGFLKGGTLPTTAEKDTLKSSEKNMLLIDYTTLANNANLFTEMASNGVEIGTWTINDRPNLDFLMALGATKIISDYFFGGLKS